jgi:hypothetical protein
MKKFFILSVSSLFLFSISNAQLKSFFKKDSSGKSGVDKIVKKLPGKGSGSLTNDEV